MNKDGVFEVPKEVQERIDEGLRQIDDRHVRRVVDLFKLPEEAFNREIEARCRRFFSERGFYIQKGTAENILAWALDPKPVAVARCPICRSPMQ